MKIDPATFRVQPDATVTLTGWPTAIPPAYTSKRDYKTLLKQDVAALSALQQLLYASSSHAILLIFQAMDAAGKDGVIKHVMSGINPQGCQVYSFKQPSAAELAHDFLWRTTRALPERGRIGIFNRSYYEEVLVARVHPEILEAHGLDPARADFWQDRYRSIRDFERHITVNGTMVLKFFLHLSKDEQRKRFLKRIDDERRNWKFSASDIKERGVWDQYMAAYEACLAATSTQAAPWYVIPADDKPNARLIVSKIILDHLASLAMAYPKTTDDRREALLAIREQLVADRS